MSDGQNGRRANPQTGDATRFTAPLDGAPHRQTHAPRGDRSRYTRGVITDAAPDDTKARARFEASDRLTELVPAPPTEPFQAATAGLCEAVTGGDTRDVQRASAAVLTVLATHFKVPEPGLRVLGVQPHRTHEGVTTYKLYGDYDLEAQRIRVWLRTAIRERVSTPKSFFSTLVHEFCHHLDRTGIGLLDTPHTRGFYHRVDQLYHLGLGTPPEARRPLHWVRARGVWRIDWTRSRAT